MGRLLAYAIAGAILIFVLCLCFAAGHALLITN